MVIISELENKLTQDGYRLDNFAFEKQRKSKVGLYALGIEYEYTVSVSGKKFSITFSDDDQFARFFYNLCSSDESVHMPGGQLLDRVIKNVERCADVTKHWLKEESWVHPGKKVRSLSFKQLLRLHGITANICLLR